jgi:hypothetical protein
LTTTATETTTQPAVVVEDATEEKEEEQRIEVTISTEIAEAALTAALLKLKSNRG